MEEMETKYGGPEEWQKVKTIEWVQIIKKNFLSDTHVLFDGQTRPSFIEKACDKNEIKKNEYKNGLLQVMHQKDDAK